MKNIFFDRIGIFMFFKPNHSVIQNIDMLYRFYQKRLFHYLLLLFKQNQKFNSISSNYSIISPFHNHPFSQYMWKISLFFFCKRDNLFQFPCFLDIAA